jgi:cell division protein FtsN
MARSRNGRRKDSAPGWAWMLFGLALGLVVAAGVYLRNQTSSGRVATPEPRAAAPSAPPAAATARSSRSQTPARPSDESRFDFYEILPQYEVVIPEVESAAAPARARPVEEPGSYVLQVGSFNALADADRRQASLALLGVESRIQRVTIDDDVYHRVRIGPISDLDSLNRVRRQLRDAGIDSMLMKVPQ